MVSLALVGLGVGGVFAVRMLEEKQARELKSNKKTERTKVAEALEPKKVAKAPEIDPEFEFRASFFKSKTCVEMGKGELAMMQVDAFHVVEVIKGNLKAKGVEVHPLTKGGVGYPSELKSGGIYRLRLTPSEHTKRQLQEIGSDGYVVVSGNEIQELKSEK